MNASGKVRNFVFLQRGTIDPSIWKHVNVVFIDHSCTLRFAQAGKTKHTSLCGDMIPRSRNLNSNNFFLQQFTHFNNATGDGEQFISPSLALFRQHVGNNPCPVRGWVTKRMANNDFQLRFHRFRGVRSLGDERGAPGALVIQAHVFAKAGRANDFHATSNKGTDGVGILVRLPGGKTLVRTIKKWDQAFLLHEIPQLPPLLVGQICTGGVVAAHVKNDDRPWFCLVQRS